MSADPVPRAILEHYSRSGQEGQWTARRETILESARAVEHEGALPGASAHIMAVGQRP